MNHTVLDSINQHNTPATLISPETVELSFVSTNNIQLSAQHIIRTIRDYYSIDSTLPTSRVLATIQEAAVYADKNYGIEAAVRWGNNYNFPPYMVRDSVQLFRKSNYSLPTMVTKRLEQLRHNRLSPSRVDTLSANNPERLLLMDLSIGMRVSIPESFKPNGRSELTPLRSTYVTVHSAVNKLMGELIIKGLAFILPKSLAIQHIPNLHFAKAHWAPKAGKPSGRAIGDLTFVDGTPLNTDSAKAHTENFYGSINHPQIKDMIKMIIAFYNAARAKNPNVKWSDLRLWKVDLKGAYTLLSFRPDDVGLFAVEVTEEQVFLQFCGIFGWTGTPAAFQVVSRALTHELNQSLTSAVAVYVDDMCGVCLSWDLDDDLVLCKSICRNLLGPDSVAEDKTESGTRLDFIGYSVDLTHQIVSIARKNFLRTLHGFLSIDLQGTINLPTAQKLASWSSRYSLICNVMSPFSSALYRMTCGRNNPHSLFAIPEDAKTAIRLWRATLFLLDYDENQFSRKFVSFDEHPCEYIIEFDASLSGVGILWYKRENNREICLGGDAVDLSCLTFQSDSSNQNVAEFMGALLGVIGLVKLGVRNVDIELRGDSVTALSWAKSNVPKGQRSMNSATIFTMFCIALSVDVKVTCHISGEDNYKCDKLSRLKESGNTVASVMSDIGLQGVETLDLESDPAVKTLVHCCDPNTTFTCEGDFAVFWNTVRDAINIIKDESRS